MSVYAIAGWIKRTTIVIERDEFSELIKSDELPNTMRCRNMELKLCTDKSVNIVAMYLHSKHIHIRVLMQIDN